MKSSQNCVQHQASANKSKPVKRARAAYGNCEVYCVDLAKNLFHVNRYSAHSECLSSKLISRKKFDALVRDPQRPRALFVLEACASANFWGLTLQDRGDQVKLVPPQFVAKQRIGNKTDRNDAEAIYAVHMDPRVHPVPLKTPAQQDQLSLNHTRSFLVKLRTALSNHLRSLLAERGLVTAKGCAGLDQLIETVTDIELTPLSVDCQPVVAVLKVFREQLSSHVDTLESKLKAQVRGSEVAQRLMAIPGVGPITASAVSAEFPDVNRYADARQFAAAMGLVPGEHSSGGKQRLGGISKRGNAYMRTLLTQGAQNVLNSACPSVRLKTLADEPSERPAERPAKTDDIHQFARQLRARKPRNVVVAAIANRMARMLYVLLKHGVSYRANRVPQEAPRTNSAAEVKNAKSVSSKNNSKSVDKKTRTVSSKDAMSTPQSLTH